jgi:hypothetical protein
MTASDLLALSDLFISHNSPQPEGRVSSAFEIERTDVEVIHTAADSIVGDG